MVAHVPGARTVPGIGVTASPLIFAYLEKGEGLDPLFIFPKRRNPPARL
jgi:hypothetical protein